MSEAKAVLKEAIAVESYPDSSWLSAMLTVKALSIFIVLDLAFYMAGFDKTLRRAVQNRTELSRLTEDKALAYMKAAVLAVQHATQIYYRRRLDCLPKSLTLFVLLKKKLPVNLCIGVKKFPFAGHAWVEYQNKILGDIPGKVAFYIPVSRV
jgi:transglutaminase superfamily protein